MTLQPDGARYRRGQYRAPLDMARVIALYQSGLSVTRVAREVGAQPQTVTNRLKAAGITLRPAGQRGYSQEVRDEALRLRREGLSKAEVAGRLQVSVNTINTWELEAGVREPVMSQAVDGPRLQVKIPQEVADAIMAEAHRRHLTFPVMARTLLIEWATRAVPDGQ